MPQLTRPFGWALPALLGLLMTGCVTTPPASSLPPLDVAQQRELLEKWTTFSLTGRVAIRNGEQGTTASVNWRQQGAMSQVRLAGPFGAGGIQLEYSPGRLTLGGRGADLENGEAEQVLERELGFVPPFDALRYWVRGLPAAAAESTETLDADGRLLQLQQLGWKIDYQRHGDVPTTAGMVQLPTLLTATRESLRLRVVIDRWQLE